MTTNEKPGFTPGPWKAVRGYSYWEVSPAERKDWEPFTVADCCPSCPGDPDGGLQEANAHLIAAAPDLYEAVRELINQVEIAFDWSNDEPGENAYLDAATDAINKAKAALAKARGEA